MATRILTEERLRSNLIVLGIVVVFSASLLVASAVFIVSSLRTVETSSADSATLVQSGVAAQEILQEMESGLRILRTIAIILDVSNAIHPQEGLDSEFALSEILQGMQRLTDAMRRLDVSTDFLSISWYGASGEGVRLYVENNTVQRIWLSEDSLIAQETVEKAFIGETAISSFHFNPVAQRRVLIHALPVYIEGRIAGVITGIYGADKIQSMLIAAVESSRQQYSYFLVDERGSFIASASSGKFPEIIYYTQGVETIMLPVLPPEARDQIQRVRNGFITIRQDNMAYRGHIRSLGSAAAGMRIICLNTDINSPSVTNQQIYTTRIIFSVFCLFVLFSMILGTSLTYTYGARLVRFLFFDEMTGADNINRFRRKLKSRLEKAQDEDDYICAATLNVRQFRSINEIFGPESARKLLLIIKETLEKNTSEDEFFCRESYDLFHACLHEREEGAIRARIEGIMEEVAQKYLESRDYHVKLYAGAVIFEGEALDRINSTEIFSCLSLAREMARENIAETVCFYNEKLHAKGEIASYIETHMDQALADKSFKLYLQPKMELSSGTPGGAEALVRWDPSGGRMIFPDQFIPLFNKNGFCVKLDMYMLEQACALIHSWIDKGIEPIPISVNQSRLLFFEASYVDNVSAIVSKYRIPPGLVTLEVLEEVYLENISEVNVKIAELRRRGFLISMDDFGSGYSSFSTIGELRVDELKLDRKFLMAASANEGWRMKIVIDQVIRMARRLHLTVVAEGVETKEDEQLVKTLGCDYGQGYYYCKPIPAEKFNELYMHNPMHGAEDEEDPFPPDFG